MDNEQTSPSYWNSVLIGALTVALITGGLGIILMYYVAGAEPSMTLMVVSGLTLPLTCLFGLVGGVIATRHYAKTFDITFTIGQGALIGLLTGAVAAIFATVISQLWMMIDPALMENFYENMIYSMEQIGMPQAQLNDAIDNMEQTRAQQQSLGGIALGVLINAIVLGIVNAITGMIGAKIFASEE
ncbi:DUF4199 domain-containing protein [Gracilimonas amylolytica]|uniref:DUF4199 domain-containing protein n=1 Tax=Gracilimonas amylolytica TaxID=1749045 RepID=UPI0012FFEFAB|nr:DUF4199 domain-containing protein [Gracilimonas amylolytica]